MKNHRLVLSTASLIILVLTGCGIQMPVTEGLVFSEDNKEYGAPMPGPLAFRLVGTIGGTSRIVASHELRSAAVDEHGSSDVQFLSREYLYAPSYPSSAFVLGDNRLALSVTPGIVFTGFHADATLKTVEEIYITANHNLSENSTELIVQRPVWKTDAGGLSAGLFFRNQRMQFTRDDERWSGSEPPFKIQWFGVRVLGQTPKIHGFGLHVRGFLNAGYVPEYEVPLVAVGMAITID